MRLPRAAAFAAVAAIVAGSLALGVAAPAEAVGLGDIYNAYSLLDYRTSVTGAALYAENPQGVQDEWGGQYARNVTKGAIQSSSGVVYGNAELTPDAIPIRPLPDVPLNTSLLGKWKQVKFTGLGLNKPVGALGLTAALTAYQYRASIADGVTSWMGIDAQGAVCGSTWASSGFVNFLTGQDCSAYGNALPALDKNADISALQGVGDCAAASSSNGTATAGMTSTWWKGVASGTHKPDCGGGNVGTYQSGTFTANGVVSVSSVAVGAASTSVGWSYAGAALSGNYIASLAFFVECVTPATGASRIMDGSGHRIPGTGTSGTVVVNGHCVAPEVPALVVTPADGSTSSAMGYGSAGVGLAYSNGTAFVGPGSDPDRTIACTYTFSDGTSSTGTTPTFKETDGSIPAPVCPIVPSGLDATHVKIVENGGGQSNVLADQDASPDPLTMVPAGFTSNAPAGIDSAYCAKTFCVQDLVDLTSGDSCFDEGDACDGWFSDPNRATKYECEYGGKEADMQQCYLYAHIFNTAKREAGDPYADPKTGDDVGAGVGPDLDSSTMGQPVGPAINPDGSFGSCLGGTYSAFNPIQWVLRPIQCGLEWAFAPRASVVQADFEGVRHSWDNTAPAKMVNAVAGWNLQPVMSGCGGYTWPNVYGSGKDFVIANACPGSALAGTAAWSRTITGVLAVVGAGLGLVRIGARVFGYQGPDE